MTDADTNAAPSPGFGEPERVRESFAQDQSAEWRGRVQPGVSRVLFGCMAAAALFSAVSAGLMWRAAGSTAHGVALVLFGAAMLVSARVAQRPHRVEASYLFVAVLLTTGSALAATASGWGLNAIGLAMFALLASVAFSLMRLRLALLLLAWMAAMLVAVFFATGGAAPAVAATMPEFPRPAIRLFLHFMLLGGGVLGGLAVSAVVMRHMSDAAEREARFRGLLAIASDAYWEIDAAYRITASHGSPRAHASLRGIPTHGALPWELPGIGFDAHTLDALLAHLDRREPFRDVALTWTSPSGQTRHLVASGKPRFGARGQFVGYWGVLRDDTEHVGARTALAATETRYHELFSSIPTPLVLHRNARVLDANAAAVDLFGYESFEQMRDQDLLARYESGDSRERERRRIEELAARPAGEGLPVTDFRVSGRVGRRVAVRATSVRVDGPDGPAVLSIYLDDTERRAAEEAVRRSEAMLSHLVATSPEVVTLTDFSTGRYAMVNHMFEQVTGHRAQDVVGRTAIEIGIWADDGSRARFVEMVQGQGPVRDFPTNFRARDGRLIQMLVSASRFAMDQRDYLVIYARDVTTTERARLEREALLETAPIGIGMTRGGRFVLTNPQLEALFGLSRGQLLGEQVSVVLPEGAAATFEVEHRPALRAGATVKLEGACLRRDGSRFAGRLLGKLIDPKQPDAGTLWMVEDETARRESEAALARARDAAEAANRAKSAFLANTSHELRTPLHGMLGLADLARGDDIDEPTRRRYLDQISESAQSLTGIITDILDLSKIEAGRLEIESTRFDLGELLRALGRGYATLAQGRGLRLELDVAPDVGGTVQGDALRVRQILGNYLGNAIKFTDRGSITVRARRLGDDVRIEVHDTGLGISAEVQSRLFRPFTQADESTTRRYGGTGLGLSICRQLAALMGGDVGVDSTPGAGAVFWVQVPLPAVTAAPRVPQPPRDALAALRGQRVLMVEDNAVNMLIAVAMLERLGVTVERAHDGREAVQAVCDAHAAARPFAAVLMDLQMPVMSGYEATRELRSLEAGRTLPIIALTAAALVSEREQALADGMNDFLTKPIDAERLAATLLRWISAAAAMPPATRVD